MIKSLNQFPKEIGRSCIDGLLSAEEERSLAAAIAAGDTAARDRLASANLRLVAGIARNYRGMGLDLDDLICEGNLGLLRATVEFDPSFGARFGAYASYWIKKSIRQALATTTATIRLPSHLTVLLLKWRKAGQELTRRLAKAPSFEEIAATLGLSGAQQATIRYALQSRQYSQELFDEIDPENSSDQRPEAEADRADELQDLRVRMTKRLCERELSLITLRFGLDGGERLTQKEVGRRLGITRQWARKIEMQALSKMKYALKDKFQP